MPSTRIGFAAGAAIRSASSPQGGGEHHQHHRCAGEWATIELMKTAAIALTRWIDYRVPEQDLRVSLRRMPTLPASGFVMTDVRPRLSP